MRRAANEKTANERKEKRRKEIEKRSVDIFPLNRDGVILNDSNKTHQYLDVSETW